MNRHIASLALVAAFFALPATAHEGDVYSSVSPAGRNVGIGVELGAPTSLNLKFMVAPREGIVLGIGGGIWYDESISLHADYLWHPLVASFDSGTFSGYIGGGAWTSLGLGNPGPHYGYYAPFFAGNEPIAVGARLPLGLTLAFNEVPVEVFIEVVPSLEVFPAIGGFGQGGLGARFYF